MLKWPSLKKKRDDGVAAPGRGPASEQIELALLASIKRGQRADFETLYRLYHPRLWRFLVHMLRHGDLVEEVLNDTLMVVWQRAESFDGRSKLSTWIFGIAYRKALKALSRQDLPVDADDIEEPADPGPGPEQQLGLAQLRVRLAEALAELSPEHRAVVELCYLQHSSRFSLACTREVVKTRMFYARRRLRLLLDDLAGAGQGEP